MRPCMRRRHVSVSLFLHRAKYIWCVGGLNLIRRRNARGDLLGSGRGWERDQLNGHDPVFNA
jgi:hypothetical protein